MKFQIFLKYLMILKLRLLKIKAINSLCEGPALNWYKENQVEMIYTYMDEKDNLVTIFKIHSSKC